MFNPLTLKLGIFWAFTAVNLIKIIAPQIKNPQQSWVLIIPSSNKLRYKEVWRLFLEFRPMNTVSYYTILLLISNALYGTSIWKICIIELLQDSGLFAQLVLLNLTHGSNCHQTCWHKVCSRCSRQCCSAENKLKRSWCLPWHQLWCHTARLRHS